MNSTRISLKRRKISQRRGPGVRSGRRMRLKKTLRSKEYKRNAFVGLGVSAMVSFSMLIVVSLFIFSYLQFVSQDLPTPEKPFGQKATTTAIYDRNGQLLYRVFDDEDRDPVNLEEVPPLVKWAFIAAEDENFYEHEGVDLVAMTRCAVRILGDSGDMCGGSTITQQLIKKTALTDEVNLERKVKEVILALMIEQDRTKDEILEMYLTVVPEGSNIYGITRGSQFYFGKDLKQLNLAEIAVLASIPQNPSQLSPTKSLVPDKAQKLLKQRQMYVLSQLEKNIDYINENTETKNGKPVLTKEMIENARTTKLVYQKPKFEINAPHFVFYAQQLLQERGYNNGKPFDLSDLETGGLRIYTTLDLDQQRVAEEQVRKGVDVYGARYGASNASLVALDPKNGEVLAYVGSYNYFGTPQPANCTPGLTCRFEPQVSIPTTLQAYGSTIKPFIYYNAFMEGMIGADSIIPDIPIQIGSYRPKNYEGNFYGLKSARWMLINSRNIPAIMLTDQLGTAKIVSELKKWGYTTFGDPSNYGPSISVGGGDVKLIEHAQAYSVFANEGKLNQHEVILRIEDVNGNVLYKHDPKPVQVADPRGIYLVNDILNGKKGGVGYSFDGRDIAGKTGTSEGQTETLYATYTPEIVVVGWLGNNTNEGMRYGASGFSSARPWVAEYVTRLGDKIPPTAFRRPDGVYYDYRGRLAINGISAPYLMRVPTQYKPSDVVSLSEWYKKR